MTKSDFITQIRHEIARHRHSKSKIEVLRSVEVNETLLSSSSSSEDESDVNFGVLHKRVKHSYNLSKKGTRLKLNDALSKATDMEGWSDARIKAYQSLKSSPNSYYYRFNAPGELQRNGPWSKEEHELFMKRLNECGADGQWGIFSMTIPGRVGYQVNNNTCLYIYFLYYFCKLVL